MNVLRFAIAVLAVVCLVFCFSAVPAQQATSQAGRRIGIEGDHFVLDGKPLQIISGELHYARIPREYWRDRLKKARAMGLNTISTYTFWNVHEPRPGQFDFTGNLDVAAFIRMAQEEGLHVILRPGPYACAEWDLGGLPAWLLADPNIVVRSGDEKFLQPAEKWLARLGQELAPLQITHGGPIIAVQVENEYGSFGDDKEYMKRILAAIRNAGLGDVLLYTADGGDELPAGTLPDIHAVANFGPGEAKTELAKLQKFRPGRPVMTGEYWDGWFDHWGEKHQSTNADQQAKEIDWILSQGYSINLYMLHGGTSFGFMNGANFDTSYQPDVTSYDYDSPVSEDGRLTKKYFAFREVIAKYRRDVTLPDPPKPLPAIEIPEFTLDESTPLWSNLPSAIASDLPVNMEAVHQSYGYILYRTRIETAAKSELVLGELRGNALVFVNGKLAGTLDRRKNQNQLTIEAPAKSSLNILVEGTGRINFKVALRTERQGIQGPVTLAGKELRDWQIFPLSMDDLEALRFVKGSGMSSNPAFHRGHFALQETGDTFLDTRGWGKGAVWINGHALGRFWNVGPQQTLYVPGPWLNRGNNEITIFAQAEPTSRRIRALNKPVLDEMGTD